MKKNAFSLLFLLLISCSSKLYIPTQNVGNISVENLKKGREIYVNSCASCHSLFTPNQYSEVSWSHYLDEMQERAKISNNEKQLILDYLVNAPK